MKYAHYDETTRQILGWYDNEIHKDIPTPNVEVKDTFWENAIEHNHNKINQDGSTEIADFRTLEETEVEKELLKKQAIAQQLATLTVTTSNGNVFDATLEARQNMADAIIASSTLGSTTTAWRMADNSEVLITLDELKEAHALAIQEYARIKGIGS